MSKDDKPTVAALSPTQLIHRIHTRQDFVEFMEVLAHDRHANPDQWENSDLDSYLEALGGFVDDLDGYFKNRGEKRSVSATFTAEPSSLPKSPRPVSEFTIFPIDSSSSLVKSTPVFSAISIILSKMSARVL